VSDSERPREKREECQPHNPVRPASLWLGAGTGIPTATAPEAVTQAELALAEYE